MDQTARQIEAHIERTREQLGSDLRELGTRVDAATDWREHVRRRPYLSIGAALVGGVVLAQLVRPGNPARRAALPLSGTSSRRNSIDAAGQAFELWDTIAHAMLGVGAAKVKSYISEMLPGFSDELQRVESRRPAG